VYAGGRCQPNANQIQVLYSSLSPLASLALGTSLAKHLSSLSTSIAFHVEQLLSHHPNLTLPLVLFLLHLRCGGLDPEFLSHFLSLSVFVSHHSFSRCSAIFLSVANIVRFVC
jgi:hypothetical protein